ncbi:MAG: hypothetical protein HQ521_02555 [Bacteroidetes bacterium]|nr:hypothetical protein [Bacteroidota bacterium]
MKTTFIIIFLTLVQIAYSQQPEAIKEKYTIEGNKVYFKFAETKVVNGNLTNYTEFPHKEPNKSDVNRHAKWMESYKDYHTYKVAFGRINYFIQNEGIDPTKLDEYQFIIYGYFANIRYQFVYDADGYGDVFGTPLKWHER